MTFKDLCKNLACHLALGMVLVFFYLSFSHGPWNPVDIKLRGVRRKTQVNLPAGQTYLLKIWGPRLPDEVRFNDQRLLHFFYRDRTRIKEQYFKIAPETLKLMNNTISISDRNSYSIRIKNNLFVNDQSGFVFKDNIPDAKGETRVREALILLVSFMLLGCFYAGFCRKVFGKTPADYLFVYTMSYALYILLMSLPLALMALSPFVFWITPFGFGGIFLVYFLASQTFFCFYMALARWREDAAGITVPRDAGIIKGDLDQQALPEIAYNVKSNVLSHSVIVWCLTRTFSEKCLLGSLLLLFLTALCLTVGLSGPAGLLANGAYLLLCAGILGKIVHSRKHGHSA